MNNKEIEIAKNNYNNLLLQKDRLEKTKERIKILEQRMDVREYLSLINLVNSQESKLSEENIAYESFSEVARRTDDSNKILVYMGAYQYNEVSIVKLVYEKDADYICYEDLETRELYKIRPSEKLEFEKNHNVIYLDNDIESNYGDHYLVGIRKLRSEFFKGLLTKPQDEVVKQLVKEK